MQPGIEKSPTYLRQWIDQNRVDRAAVARVMEGIEISAQREIPELVAGQQPTVFIPGLSATPWWDEGRFEWILGLEAAVAGITDDFEAVGGLSGRRVIPQPTDLTDKGRWTALYLYCVGKAYSKNIEACPSTIRALDAVPGATMADGGMTYFSIMDPQTHVATHTGYTNAHLRCHLGLVTPTGCRLRVGNKTREWERGKVFVFDDSFDHEAWNDGESGRAVLLFDIWHPDLTELEIRALSYLMGVWRRLQARSFWATELVGVKSEWDVMS
jgi:aspartate beta-hydroxylase